MQQENVLTLAFQLKSQPETLGPSTSQKNIEQQTPKANTLYIDSL